MRTLAKDSNMQNLAERLWPIIPAGADRGIGTEGDALPRVTQLGDGADINAVWQTMAQALQVWNQNRSALASLLTFEHTNASDAIPQSQDLSSIFEEATEFGEPESIRPMGYLRLGYTFEHFDTATRFSWRALMEMSTEQVLATANLAIAGDEHKINRDIMTRLFNPEQTANENETPVYGLWNGDGQVPPAYQGKLFTSNHTHYLVSGNDEIDSGDIEALAKHVGEHGYLADPGAQLLLLCNPEQAEKIASFRAGEISANTIVAHHDYVPSTSTPAFYTPGGIEGKRAPGDIAGLKISGSYGPLWIMPLDDVPVDYLACVATYGQNSPNNVIGFRQHTSSRLQGLLQIPGPVPGYPLQESFFTHSYGLGVRRRGQAAVMQIKETGDYEVPEILFA
jgi:hypothetical protein